MTGIEQCMHAEHAVPKTGKVCVVDGYHLRDLGHVTSYVVVLHGQKSNIIPLHILIRSQFRGHNSAYI